ncbi:MAG TPA: hypothetical protein VGN13_01635 [Solirubrobacteraceae bacterium]|jgi:hypothetical protein
MVLALGTGGVLLVVLVWELSRPTLARAVARTRALWLARSREGSAGGYDPGRERRAEQRARVLLRSCVDEHDWAMYRELGFLRVWGSLSDPGDGREPGYAYLIYPHKPIVAYIPASGALLNEYCVAFPDNSRPYGSARLPHSDDVLAKWMALTADERRLVGEANMHLPGRQIDPERVRRDLARLAQWERQRAGGVALAPPPDARRAPVARGDNVRAA